MAPSLGLLLAGRAERLNRSAFNLGNSGIAALMFGFFDAIGLRLQEYLSADLTNLIPYVITVVMMVYVVVRAQQRKKHRARSALAQKGKSA